MIATHIAAAVVAAFATFAVMQLRIDAIEGGHEVAVGKLEKKHSDGVGKLRADHQTAVDKANAEARATQDTITFQYQEALNASRQQTEALRINSRTARYELDGLRELARIAASRVNVPEVPASTLSEFATAASELLTDCGREYQELAEKADQHALDAGLIQDAWPRTKPASIP